MVTGISLEQAISLMTAPLSPLGEESLPLEHLLGRILARDIVAPIHQPPFDRSPLDGYALRAIDTQGASRDTPAILRVVDTVYAGDVARVPVGAGEAVRIMTGAMLPSGCDCVIRQEDTCREGDRVAVYTSLSPHQNYVDRGEDYTQGTLLLPAGTRLDSGAIGVLAGAGLTQAPVHRLPRVGILTTGDEVVSPGTYPLPPGKIYGANLALISARLRELGICGILGSHAPDRAEGVAQAMEEMLASCDLLITTGGVSVGERDIFHQALPLLGAEQVFWRVQVKPGTPAMYSTKAGKPILSLSGNPFAAAATFELLARPLLAALVGDDTLLPRRATALMDTPFLKASPSRRFLRGRWQEGRVTLPQNHASGNLSSLVGCNCLVDVPAGSPPLEVGAQVTIQFL